MEGVCLPLVTFIYQSPRDEASNFRANGPALQSVEPIEHRHQADESTQDVHYEMVSRNVRSQESDGLSMYQAGGFLFTASSTNTQFLFLYRFLARCLFTPRYGRIVSVHRYKSFLLCGTGGKKWSGGSPCQRCWRRYSWLDAFFNLRKGMTCCCCCCC